MLKSDLIKIIADRENMSAVKAEEIISRFFDIIIKACANSAGSRRVEIRGFGNFTVRKYKAYQGKNPKTEQKIHVEAKQKPFWKSSYQLHKLINL